MRRLIRLYPSAWRERYGDEMDAVLEERALGPFEIADLLLGALDAHLHLGRLGDRFEHRKGITMSLRIAGFAAIVGGLLWALVWALDYYVVSTVAQGGEDQARLFLAAPAIALLVAIAGLSSFQARAHHAEVWTSFAITAIGVGLLIVGWGIIPLLSGDPAWGIGFMGGLALLIGTILFARVTYVTAALSRSAVMLLGIGALLGLVSIGVAIVWDALEGRLILSLGGVAFAIGWIALGIDAIRRDRLTTSPRPSAT